MQYKLESSSKILFLKKQLTNWYEDKEAYHLLQNLAYQTSRSCRVFISPLLGVVHQKSHFSSRIIRMRHGVCFFLFFLGPSKTSSYGCNYKRNNTTFWKCNLAVSHMDHIDFLSPFRTPSLRSNFYSTKNKCVC